MEGEREGVGIRSRARSVLEPRTAHGSEVEMLACSRATVTAHHPVPIQIDGDAFGTTPIEVDAGTSEVRLIVPAPTADGTNSVR